MSFCKIYLLKNLLLSSKLLKLLAYPFAVYGIYSYSALFFMAWVICLSVFFLFPSSLPPSSAPFLQFLLPSSSPQSFPASGTFLMSCLFTSDDQNTRASASLSVLPVNIQGSSPLRLTGLISLLSKGLSGVFSSTTVPRHQFFGVLPTLQSISHNLT